MSRNRPAADRVHGSLGGMGRARVVAALLALLALVVTLVGWPAVGMPVAHAAAGPVRCTVPVPDPAAARRAMAAAGPGDVVCLRGGVSPGASPGGSPVAGASPVGSPVVGGPPGGSGSGAATVGATEGGPPGAAVPARGGCAQQVTDAGSLSRALAAANPGQRVCVTGDLAATRLTIARGGSAQAPLSVVGTGRTVVKGITVNASNVLVEGFQVLGAEAPGIMIKANGVTVRNNTVKSPTGGDYDGLRFFGNNLRIVHNTIADINPKGSGAHADCMQTFTNGMPSSEHVLIDGNRCANIDNQCLMAEGPGDVGDGGGGDGTSADWTISNNICQFGAGQGLMIEAVQHVTISHNQFTGHSDKAIGLDIGATGATVTANRIDSGIKNAVGISQDSRQGYRGPPASDGA